MSEKAPTPSINPEEMLEQAGFGPAETSYEFRKIEEEPVDFVVSAWAGVREDNNLAAVPFVSRDQEYDGVGVAAEASPDQVRLALVHHYRQITNLETIEERQEYWIANPVINRYLEMAKGE